jgi:hypothetical protein
MKLKGFGCFGEKVLVELLRSFYVEHGAKMFQEYRHYAMVTLFNLPHEIEICSFYSYGQPDTL